MIDESLAELHLGDVGPQLPVAAHGAVDSPLVITVGSASQDALGRVAGRLDRTYGTDGVPACRDQGWHSTWADRCWISWWRPGCWPEADPVLAVLGGWSWRPPATTCSAGSCDVLPAVAGVAAGAAG